MRKLLEKGLERVKSNEVLVIKSICMSIDDIRFIIDLLLNDSTYYMLKYPNIRTVITKYVYCYCISFLNALKYDEDLKNRFKKKSSEEYYAFVDIKLTKSFTITLNVSLNINY
jgi:hypothetical protein